MFDEVTASIIASAPHLTGVNSDKLAASITDAYVRVAVARSLVGETAVDREPIFDDLRSIAAAQEAIALTLQPSQLRASAAYVAASAYRVISDADMNADPSSFLEPTRISVTVASMLLFMVADSAADAAEVASTLPSEVSGDFAVLLGLLRQLGRGEFSRQFAGPPTERPDTSNPAAVAAAIGYSRIAKRLQALMAHLSGADASWTAGEFGEIADSMVFEFETRTRGRHVPAMNVIGGPWHLTRLLGMVEPELIRSATAMVSAPDSIGRDEWETVLTRVAKSRPLLWRNHRSAISDGLLEAGTSAVLSFPTGAGKSTLSELKIASCALSGRNVICLVPTLSLIDQFSRSVKSTIPEARVIAQQELDASLEPSGGGRVEIFVMTPESCLTALGMNLDRFGDVGLVMFDEAHLMHSAGDSPSRRAVDASLCFLTLATRFPTADLMLVSAMLSNADDLTEWLATLTGRPAISLDSPWKPTRQARGALIYRREELNTLRAQLREQYESSESQGAPAWLRREMQAVPHGFFSLRSTWHSTNTEDYRLVPLLSHPVELAVGGSRDRDGAWWLTPNANVVAGQMASAAADAQIKTLIFTQQVTHAVSLASKVTTPERARVPLTRVELELVAETVEALGEQSAMYLDVLDGGVSATAIPHHGLLLRAERRLHESLYRRSDGIPVLVATSTVSQGMNFPSELVIIAGDRRFDQDSNARLRLEAHELLNAAGRAGRAGAHSHALVIVIPGQIVGYDGEASMDSGWFLLQSDFEQSDQCVSLKDPLGDLLASLDSVERPLLLEYLSRRLGSADEAGAGASMVRRSLAAFMAARAEQSQIFDRQVQQLLHEIEQDSVEPWLRRCAAVSGIPTADLDFIALAIDRVADLNKPLLWWRDWLLDVLRDRPTLVEETLRAGSRSALAGVTEELGRWDTSGVELLAQLRTFIPEWMSGATLARIQAVGTEAGLARRTDRHFEFARKFALRVVPDVSYLFSLPALILDQRAALNLADSLDESHPIYYLARAVESGVDSIPKLDVMNAGATRAVAHRAAR